MQSRSVRMLSRNDRLPDLWDTHGISGIVFCKSTGVFFITLYLDKVQPVNSNVSEHTSPHVKSERQTPDTTLDPRCQFSEGRFSKNYGDCKFRIFILKNSLTQQYVLVGRQDSRLRYVLVVDGNRGLWQLVGSHHG